jgi:sugar-specific transcriptional regulator TrmB
MFEYIVIFASLGGALVALLLAIHAYWPFRPRSNDSFEIAIKEASEFINKAKYELKILSGTLYPPFYNAEPISQALEECVNRDVNVKILCGPDANIDDVPKLKELNKQKKIKIRRWTQEPPFHFMVCDDGKHIRLEATHPKGEVKFIKARIIYNSVELGWKYDRLFDNLWNSASRE